MNKLACLLWIILMSYSCKDEITQDCEFGFCWCKNYYILKDINIKCFVKVNTYTYNPLTIDDTVSAKDFLLSINLIGNIIIESQYKKLGPCREINYFVNKVKLFKIDSASIPLVFKSQPVKTGEEIGTSPLLLAVDTISFDNLDTVIQLKGKVQIIDVKDNVYSALIPNVYVKF